MHVADVYFTVSSLLNMNATTISYPGHHHSSSELISFLQLIINKLKSLTAIINHNQSLSNTVNHSIPSTTMIIDYKFSSSIITGRNKIAGLCPKL